MTTRSSWLPMVLALLTGCGDDDAASDGPVLDASPVGDAAGGGGDGSSGPCSAEGAVGPAGGTFQGCGATVLVPAGSVAAETSLRVERSPVTGEAPYLYAFASDAYAFTADPPSLAGPVAVTLPYGGSLARPSPATLFEGGWGTIEGCSAQDGQLNFVVGVLRTFAVVGLTVPMPDSVDGLGSGTLTAVFDGTTYSFDADALSSFAIYEPARDGSRAPRIELRDPVSQDYLRLVLGISADGATVGILEIALGLYDGVDYTLWGYLLPLDGEAGSITLTAPAGDTLEGTLTIPLHLGSDRDVVETLTAELDLELEPYVFPGEATCL